MNGLWILWLLLLMACSTRKADEFTSFKQQYISHIATDTQTPIVATVVAGSLDVPWEITWGPDGWIWFTEQRGTVNRLDPETGERQMLLQLSDVHFQKSRGLLGMALHPDFANSPYVYFDYTYDLPDSSIVSKLVRYTYTQDTLIDPKVLLEGIPGNTYHNGARVIVTPDHKILMSTGDAGHVDDAQNLNSLSGKLLRLNLDGSIPEDNPIPGSYIWSWGHRNPQGLIAASNGKIYSSEHGPDNDDEVNLILKGRNYGWPDIMGYCDLASEKVYCTDSNIVEPMKAWSPVIAPSGLDYYDSDIIPEWKNSLVMGSLKSQGFRVLHLNQTGDIIINEEVLFIKEFGRIRDVCVSPDGTIYLSTSNRDWHPGYFPEFYDTYPRSFDDRIIKLTKASPIQTAWLDTAAFTQQRAALASEPGTINDSTQVNALYQQYCSGCHQLDGKGVSGLYPPLAQTDWVTGDKERLIQTVLQGLSEPIQVNGITYDEQMPPYKFLSDEQLAEILTYIRQHFGNDANAIETEEVATVRKELKI